MAPVDVDERAAAALCYTSGTTGDPKGVLYSHRSIVLHALSMAGRDVFRIGEQDVVLGLVPLFHALGWGLPFVCGLTGADMVLPGPNLAPGGGGRADLGAPRDLGGRRSHGVDGPAAGRRGAGDRATPRSTCRA